MRSDVEQYDEESSTSQANVLDLDEIAVYDPKGEEKHVLNGKRSGPRQRPYRTKDGHNICADVNGVYNIRKLRSLMHMQMQREQSGYVAHLGRIVVPMGMKEKVESLENALLFGTMIQ